MLKPTLPLFGISLLALILSGCNSTGEIITENSAASPAQLADKYITAKALRQDIQTLASDEFGGRTPFSEGEKLTLDFIEKQFIADGLKPMFGNSYRQAVPMVAITALPKSIKVNLEQNGRQRALKYGPEIMLGTSQVVNRIDVIDSEVVFVGYGIVAPEYEWDDYYGLNVKGKTVMVLINDPGFVDQDPSFFKGKAMTYYGRWTYKYEEAARQGATGVIIIHDTKPAAYPWKVVESSWSGPQFFLDSTNGNMDRLPFESWVTYDVAKSMFSAAGYNLDEIKTEATSNDFEALDLHARISIHLQNTLEKSQSYNVGAVLPGSEKADELFFYMGHWDHLGTDTSAKPGVDNIYNGAVDNATGVAGVLALAKTFSHLPQAPKRSIGFLAVTAEESGLLGSAYYTAHPAFPMAKTVAGINMDAMNVYGPTEDIVVVGYGSSSLEDSLKKSAQKQQRQVEPEPFPEKGGFYRSDHFNFAKRGVPVLYAKGGVRHKQKGQQYMLDLYADYTSHRYHAPADEITADWDLNGLVEDLKLFFDIGNVYANSTSWPYWYEGNEFEAIRKASMKAEKTN